MVVRFERSLAGCSLNAVAASSTSAATSCQPQPTAGAFNSLMGIMGRVLAPAALAAAARQPQGGVARRWLLLLGFPERPEVDAAIVRGEEVEESLVVLLRHAE